MVMSMRAGNNDRENTEGNERKKSSGGG